MQHTSSVFFLFPFEILSKTTISDCQQSNKRYKSNNPLNTSLNIPKATKDNAYFVTVVSDEWNFIDFCKAVNLKIKEAYSTTIINKSIKRYQVALSWVMRQKSIPKEVKTYIRFPKKEFVCIIVTNYYWMNIPFNSKQ